MPLGQGGTTPRAADVSEAKRRRGSNSTLDSTPPFSCLISGRKPLQRGHFCCLKRECRHSWLCGREVLQRSSVRTSKVPMNPMCWLFSSIRSGTVPEGGVPWGCRVEAHRLVALWVRFRGGCCTAFWSCELASQARHPVIPPGPQALPQQQTYLLLLETDGVCTPHSEPVAPLSSPGFFRVMLDI